jgi:hypothetical protein
MVISTWTGTPHTLQLMAYEKAFGTQRTSSPSRKFSHAPCALPVGLRDSIKARLGAPPQRPPRESLQPGLIDDGQHPLPEL